MMMTSVVMMMILVMIKQAMLAKIKIEPCTAPSCLPEQ